MKGCDVRVVAPGGRDWTTLAEQLRRLGHAVTDVNDEGTPHADDEIIVIDARGSCAAEWEEIENDLGDQPGAVVVITDEPREVAEHVQRLGRSVVLSSGDSDMGYGVAVKLCALMRQDERATVAA